MVAALLAATRWLRVSQREHYLANGCRSTAMRWLRARPLLNGTVLVVSVAAAVAGMLTEYPTSTVLLVVAAVAAAGFPLFMPLRGRTARLDPTRRLRTLAAAVLVLSTAVGGALSWATTPAAGPVAVAVLMPLLVDTSAAVLRPFEVRAADRFRHKAEGIIRSVSPRVVAITGSYGKTSTKEHVRELLGTNLDVVASPASWNNMAGLSRAVNEFLRPGTEVFVAEMGTYGPGEIRDLVAWLQPEVAVITAVGPVHLERMGNLAAITRAKAEILAGARHAVLGVDSPELSELAETVDPATTLWRCGSRGQSGLDVEATAGPDGFAFRIHDHIIGPVTLPVGVHAANVACAVAVASALGLSPPQIEARLGSLQAAQHRAAAAVTPDGVIVIDDTFNSNPDGARAALQQLMTEVPEADRVVITPGMVELGPIQARENERLASEIAAAGCALVIVGRTNRRALLRGAGEAVTVANRDQAVAWVRDNLHPGDGVLWENDLPDHYP
ncbi:MAG: UDP-N-acetylmuramoyl-tripeptide--D-alanyl-D-alanine ligase [Acidimicrobiales bacterium]|nr:UDP-N-acetylmuramoyl-tripeptide--D-alanyl-D-alanine ligase [Acidimicrobiales bacterium]